MAAKKLPLVYNAGDVEALVADIGILPFVGCGIPGFSLQECTPPGYWFVRDVEGPWEWRETVADNGRVAYAKLLRRKAAFVSPEWYAHFVNWRRGGIDFEERYEAGMIAKREKDIMDLLLANGPMLSPDLKAIMGNKGFDCAMMSLQMRTDVVIQRVEYRRDAFGRPYGMGRSRFAPSEVVFGEDALFDCGGISPEASLQKIVAHIQSLFPDAAEGDILRLVQ